MSDTLTAFSIGKEHYQVIADAPQPPCIATVQHSAPHPKLGGMVWTDVDLDIANHENVLTATLAALGKRFKCAVAAGFHPVMLRVQPVHHAPGQKPILVHGITAGATISLSWSTEIGAA